MEISTNQKQSEPRESKRNTSYRFMEIDDKKLTADRKNVNVTSDEFMVKGWAFDKHSNAPAKDVYIVINNKRYKCSYGLERKSIAERFENPSLLKTGFSRKLKKADYEQGKHQISIVIVSTDGKVEYTNPKKPLFFTILK